MNKRLSLLTVLAVVSIPCMFADSSVWKISREGNELYLAGTVHVLSQSDYPLPEEFDRAYDDSDIVIFETDIRATQTEQFQQQLVSALTFQDGLTLRNLVSKKTYDSLSRYFRRYGIPISSLNSFKPSLIALTINSLELRRIGIDTPGVDFHFAERAGADGKPCGFLETLEQQIAFIEGMGRGMEDAFIENTFADIEALPETMEAMISSWRSGDGETLETLFNEETRRGAPELYRQLIVDRNNAWLPRLQEYLKTAPVEFILVGAAHVVGPDGLLAALKKLGCRVEQL